MHDFGISARYIKSGFNSDNDKICQSVLLEKKGA